MAEKPVPLTEAEWNIMLLLWDHHPQTMMELTRALEPRTGWTKHTVITMLKRMQQKGTVLIDETGPVKRYAPAVERSRVQQEQTQTLLNRLFAGRASLLASELVRSGTMTDEELRDLEAIIAQTRKKP